MRQKLMCNGVADVQSQHMHTLWTSTCLGFNLNVNHLCAYLHTGLVFHLSFCKAFCEFTQIRRF